MNTKAYGILCVNRGVRSWVKNNGEIVTFETIGRAQIEIDRIYARQGRIYNLIEYFAEEISDVLYRVVYTRHNEETILACKETLEEAIEAAKAHRKEYQVGFITVEKGKGDETKILYGH